MLRPWLRPLRSVCLRHPLRPFAPIKFPTSIRLQSVSADRVPLRKHLKQQAKTLRSHKRQRKEDEEASRQEWELTVGVEIHAQLNTDAKLFSSTFLFWTLPTLNICLTNRIGAATSTSDVPNSNVALFDLAFPGSQPVSAMQSSVGALLIRMIGISNRNTFTGSAGCDRPELRDPACQSIRPQTLFLPGSTGRIPNYTILW